MSRQNSLTAPFLNWSYEDDVSWQTKQVEAKRENVCGLHIIYTHITQPMTLAFHTKDILITPWSEAEAAPLHAIALFEYNRFYFSNHSKT